PSTSTCARLTRCSTARICAGYVSQPPRALPPALAAAVEASSRADNSDGLEPRLPRFLDAVAVAELEFAAHQPQQGQVGSRAGLQTAHVARAANARRGRRRDTTNNVHERQTEVEELAGGGRQIENRSADIPGMNVGADRVRKQALLQAGMRHGPGETP